MRKTLTCLKASALETILFLANNGARVNKEFRSDQERNNANLSRQLHSDGKCNTRAEHDLSQRSNIFVISPLAVTHRPSSPSSPPPRVTIAIDLIKSHLASISAIARKLDGWLLQLSGFEPVRFRNTIGY